MKRIASLALAVLLCLSVLTACGGKKSDSSETPSNNDSQSSGPVELVFWHNRGGSAGETLDKIVNEFNEGAGAEAGIKITAVYQQDTVSTLKTLVQSKDVKNYPDMIQIFAGDVEYMSTVDAVVPVGDMMAEDSFLRCQDPGFSDQHLYLQRHPVFHAVPCLHYGLLLEQDCLC